MDPIEREDFNIRRGRQANPERMERINFFAKRKGYYGDLLITAIREAIASGHSYRQVAEAAGVSVSVIQRILFNKKRRHGNDH